MGIKIVFGIVAVLLVFAFVLPPAVKLNDPALTIVIAIGIVIMLIDLYQSLHERD